MSREEQDGIKTVECLRGRLLAERMASKTAMAEADHMAKRLAELEKQLEEEMEHRGKAEKKLKHALKKLESLMVSDFPDRMDLSDSSVGSSSSNKCFLSKGGLEKWKDFEQCGSPGSMNSFSDSAHQLVSQDGSCISVGTASSRNKEASQGDEVSNGNGFHFFADGTVRQSLNDKSCSIEDNLTKCPAEESLALVPVSIPQEPVAIPEAKKDAYDVIFALRHVREQLQKIGRTVP